MSCRYFVLTRTGEKDDPASKAFTGFIVDGDSPGLTKGKKVTQRRLYLLLFPSIYKLSSQHRSRSTGVYMLRPDSQPDPLRSRLTRFATFYFSFYFVVASFEAGLGTSYGTWLRSGQGSGSRLCVAGMQGGQGGWLRSGLARYGGQLWNGLDKTA